MAGRFLLLGFAVLLFASDAMASQSVTAHEPTYAALAPFKKQWSIALAQKAVDGTFIAHKCNYTNISNKSSCLYPVNIYGNGDEVQVTFSLLNVTRGLRVGTPAGNVSSDVLPTSVEVKMCYSAYSYQDRPWRKKNRAYPRLDQNCNFKIHEFPYSDVVANNFTMTALVEFDELENVPTASFWFMVRTWCNNGHVCQWDSTETTAANGANANAVGTEVWMGITSAMIACAVVLSVLGPAVLVGYGIADHLHYKKTGKPLTYVG